MGEILASSSMPSQSPGFPRLRKKVGKSKSNAPERTNKADLLRSQSLSRVNHLWMWLVLVLSALGNSTSTGKEAISMLGLIHQFQLTNLHLASQCAPTSVSLPLDESLLIERSMNKCDVESFGAFLLEVICGRTLAPVGRNE